ncbi:MAG: thioredoxin domain-containing protein [Planctomycetales bacterium]|nr:thioredoxin domain-containing protein [Planctomycetales bacterium]
MPNRLAQETSPYLLQHANNPVEWWPWCDEAIQTARRHERPIFLSIGYSACHWCHVMEHESFEDPVMAALMSERFVCIKVDREERPDLDQIYMSAVQAMTGSGGWPMSVFLTPELKPFYGGTYWPPTARWGRPGFREILLGVSDAWQNRREAVLVQSEELTSHVVDAAASRVTPSPLNEDILRRAMQSLLRSADRVHGGFGSAPKFPHPMDLRVALRCSRRFQADEVLDVALLTLNKMANGGIYDHLGGGFARYSTDERWLVPHFEKMLYDNALLVPAYLEAFQITGDPDYARVARETLDYILREMTQPQGGFYATQDADSEGVEGKFFVWSEAEVDAVLAPLSPALRGEGPGVRGSSSFSIPSSEDRKTEEEPLTLTLSPQSRGEGTGAESPSSPSTLAFSLSTTFKLCYDISARGNWEHTNILNRAISHADAATKLKVDPTQLEAVLATCRQKLFDVRSERVWPGRDEKVLASWNGLMIAAMSLGANVLSEPKYADAARAAADFILREMVEVSGPESGGRSQETEDGNQYENGTLVPSPPSSGERVRVRGPNGDDTSQLRTAEERTSHPNPLPSNARGEGAGAGSPPSTLHPQPSARLLHSYKDGRARFNAYLDDYAALIDGLCELYQTVFDAKYLDAALGLAQRMLDQFWDEADGGFFYTSNDHETLIARNKETHDNATPSGNSLAATALLKLARLTGRTDLEAKAVATLELMSGLMNRIPLAAGQSLIALDFLLGPTHEVVIVDGLRGQSSGDRGQAGNSTRVLAELHQRFVPNKVVHLREATTLDESLPLSTRSMLKGKSAVNDETSLYICRFGTCEQPVVGTTAITVAIERL